MISLLCPTRQRPDDFTRLWQSAMETAAEPENVEIVAVIDKGDLSYEAIDLPRVKWVGAGESVIFSDLWNLAWKHAEGDIYQMAADDEVFCTEDWDLIVRGAFDQFPDRIAFVYGDTNTRAGFGELGFISREWTDITGEFTYGGFYHDYADTWLDDIGNRIGRHVHVDILTDHLRRMDGRAPHDATSEGLRERLANHYSGDLFAELEPEREAIAKRLRAAIVARTRIGGPCCWCPWGVCDGSCLC